MPRAAADDYRNAYTVYSRGGDDGLKSSLLADAERADSNNGVAEPLGSLQQPADASGSLPGGIGAGLPPLSRDQKRKWGLMVGLSLLGTLAGTIPGPLMIFLQVRSDILRAAVLQRPSAAVVLTLCALCQSQYFNDGKPCITKAETDSQGCKDALSTISFVSGWYLPSRLPSASAALSDLGCCTGSKLGPAFWPSSSRP